MWISLNKRRKLDIAYHKTSCTSKKSMCNIIIILRQHPYSRRIRINSYSPQAGLYLKYLYLKNSCICNTIVSCIFSILYFSGAGLKVFCIFVFQILRLTLNFIIWITKYRILSIFHFEEILKCKIREKYFCIVLKCKIQNKIVL